MNSLLPLIQDENLQTIDTVLKILEEFLTQNESQFEFSGIDQEEYQKLILKLASYYFSVYKSIAHKAFNVLRLLSRDRTLVLKIKNITDLMIHAKTILNTDENDAENTSTTQIECLKCLCNWLYHSADIRQSFLENKLLSWTLKELFLSSVLEKKFFGIRLLFLVSALETSSRTLMLENDILSIMVKVSRLCMDMTGKTDSEKSLSIRTLCEVLKTLFNVLLEAGDGLSDANKDTCKVLSNIMCKLIVEFHPFDVNSEDDLLTHIVHLLINLPKNGVNVFLEKINKVDEHGKDKTKDERPVYYSYQDELKQVTLHCTEGKDILYSYVNVQEQKFIKLLFEKMPFSGFVLAYYKDFHKHPLMVYDMSPIIILIESLSERMEIKNYMSMKEKTLSILTAFCYICRINRPIRKYLRQEILPPITPSNIKPEDQPGLRGQIVKLMTTVDVPLKNMAADFLFVLCKENSERLVRYAGYGNSAGFLASRGLMIPGMSHADGDYSEDELSDVEGDLDAMTGATPIPKEDPMANMTESEKQAEMEKLLVMMDRLRGLNVIKPMAVNKDGKITELKPSEENEEDD